MCILSTIAIDTFQDGTIIQCWQRVMIEAPEFSARLESKVDPRTH